MSKQCEHEYEYEFEQKGQVSNATTAYMCKSKPVTQASFMDSEDLNGF